MGRSLRRAARRARNEAPRARSARLEFLEDRTLLSATTQTALDAYIAAPDPAYHYSLNSTITGPGYTDYVINMISQTWRSPSEVNSTVWQHWLEVIVPTTVKTHTGLLDIGGGSNGAAPTSADPTGVQAATTIGAITTVLPTVPNEPLTFAGQTQSFTEDQIVAYSFEQFLNGGDQNWPVLLPMVKSAVKAMDTTQSFIASESGGSLSVDNFIVSGASKRGWTTWLTPAVDNRVVAIVPFVFDLLNQSQSVPNLADTYVGVTQHIVGGYPDAVEDYTNDGVFAAADTPQGQALQQIVDPFTYIDRSTYDIPKYMVDSTGDQFFVPDSSIFYINLLPGQNYLRAVPNTDHGLDQDAVNGAINFEKALVDGAQLPQYTWTISNAGATISLHSTTTPASVTMWQATNPNNRDFRLEDFGANWTSSPLSDQGAGNYVANVTVPSTGATAFFIQMTYNVDGVTLTFTTSVSEVPLFKPTLAIADASGTYTGQPYAATGTATGLTGSPVPGSFIYTYYTGNTVSGTGTTTAPTAPGTYTIVGSFASSDPAYLNGQTSALTFTISDVQLNNGVLTVYGDGSSTIVVTLYDSGALDVSVNGNQQHYNPGTVSSIVVDGAGGSDNLTVVDTGTASSRTYNLTATQIDRSGAQPITYSDLPTITLDAGDHGNTVDWQGSSNGVFYLYTGTGTNTIDFGDANHTVNSFAGAPVVEGQGSNNTVNVYDQGNTTARTYVITADAFSPSGGEGFGYGVDIQHANYFLGSGGNVVDWQGTAAGETVTTYTGTGTNVINFGDTNNTLDGFLGTPILEGQGSSNTVNVYDQGSSNPHTYVITPTSLSRDGGAGYFYDVQTTNYNLGDGGNVIDWQGTAAGDTTTVYTGTGTNTINMGDGAQTLDEFASTPDLVGQGTGNTLNYYDQGTTSTPFWNGFGGNSQHTADSSVPGQPLTGISWQTPVDLAPPYTSGGEILEHYGEPVVTQANTVILPLKLPGTPAGIVIEAIDGNSGAVRWGVPSDWNMPNSSWLPSYNVAMTPSGRVYFAGAGGTLYYFDNPDSATAPVVHQVAFYGLSNYQNNELAFINSVFVDTPLTTDANGDVYFGFRVQGTAPAPLSTTQSGYARIDPNGNAKYVLVGNMTGDGNISLDSMNAAPALSNDGSTLYVLAKSTSQYYGYLVALNATTLGTESKVFLADPRNGAGAGILDVSTASPMVAPDGTVYIGVMGNPYNGSRGFMLHFSANLSQEYTPGAFGWDDTASIVPASMVPGYTGTSSYLIFVKYNNYVTADAGPTGGNGVNEIAILDPNATQLDNRNDSDPSLHVMKEVMTIADPTPDTDYTAQFPDAVHEWCINSCVVDPASDSIYANAEDGDVYCWNLATDTLSQAVTLTPGLGEAYTPTWMGPDGRVYAINNAILFSVGITGWGGHDGDAFTAPDYSTAPAAAGTTAPHTYVLNGSSVSRDGFAYDYSGVQTVNFYAGSGGNTIDWQGSSATTTVYTGTGTNTINFGDANNTLDSFVGTPTLQDQGSGDTVNVYDSGSTAAHTYVITTDSLTRDGGSGYAYGTGITAVNYYLGSGGNTVDWQGTAPGVTTTVYTGTGTNTINFGDTNNTLDGFDGTPILQGQGSNNTANVYDQGSTAAHTYVITATSLTRDGGTGYGYDLQNINYYFGSGGNTIDWQGNAFGQIENQAVYTGTGVNTINFGDANNTLDSFGNTIALYGQGSNNTVNVYDQGTTYGRNYVLGTGPDGASTFSLDGGAAYDYAYDIQAANLYLAEGGNTVDWQGVAAGLTTTVYTGTGTNAINFGDVNNTLDGFEGTPILQGQGSNNTVNVYDSGTTAPRSYVLTANSFSPNGGEGYGYGYDIQTANYYLGSGGNTVDWQGVAAGETVMTYTGTSVNTINFGDANNTVDSFAGTPILQGQGDNNTVNVYDSGTTAPRSYVFTANSFSPNGGEGFGYGYDIQAANYYLGSGGNTVDWQGVASGETVTVYSGTGTNTINFGDANNTLDSFGGTPILQDQGTGDTVNVYDSGSTAAHTYVITADSLTRDGGTGYGYGSGITAVNYYLGSGGNTVDWQGTAPGVTTTVYTGAGTNTINFGDANNTLDGFGGTPILQGQGSNNTVNVYDSGTTTPRDYVFTATAFSPNGGEGYGYGYDIQTANYYLGSGGNTVDWQGVASGETVSVYTGSGINTIDVGDTNNTLDGFQGTPIIQGQGSNNTVNIYDSGNTAATNYVVAPNAFSASGGAGYGYGYDLQNINIYFGTGANTVDWQGNSAGAVYTADFPGGSDQLSGSYDASATTIDAAVTLTGTAAFGNLAIASQGSLDLSQAAAGTVTATGVNNQGTITGSGYLTLADSGDFTSGNLNLALGGNAGTTYDQVQVGGTATLDGSLSLSLAPGFVPTPGSTYTIVEDTGGTPVSGMFTNLPNGKLITVSGTNGSDQPFTTLFQIEYEGDNVVLTNVAQPQVTANNATVTVPAGTTATNSGTWTQTGFAGADIITASVGTITQTGSGGSGTWSWSFPVTSTSQSQTVTITASDGQGDMATTTFSLVVKAFGSTTSVTSTADPSVFGQKVTFQATVKHLSGNQTPSGSVEFLDGNTVLATVTLNGGKANFSTTALAIGGHSISVVYSGDSNFSGSTSSVLTQTVNQASTTSKVTASVNPSVYGQNVTFTATVSAVSPGTGTPTGSVEFLDGSTVLQTVPLNASGKATYATNALSVGGHSITVSYSGDTDYTNSTSSSLAFTVNQAASTSKVTSSSDPSVFGQGVTFTATVSAKSPGSGTPTGMVSFLDGSTVLYTTALSAGTASYTTSSLSVATHPISVQYSGDSNFTGSTSNTVNQAVHQASTKTMISSSVNPSTTGQSVTFTAVVSVTAPGAGTPTGSITFKDGSNVLMTVPVDGTGTAKYTTSSLTKGNHNISAAYNGDTNFRNSNQASLTQVVNASGAMVVQDAIAASAAAPVRANSVLLVVPGTGNGTSSPTESAQAATVFTASISGSLQQPSSPNGQDTANGASSLDRFFAAFGNGKVDLSDTEADNGIA
jgi:PhoPQ-activated pathogenicity-related protein